MAIVGFDYGHGGKDPGATYKGRKEADDVLKVGMKTAAVMRRHNVIVDETRTTDKTLSLRQRSNFLNRKEYDYVVSYHRNAFKPEVAQGVETYAHPKSNAKSKALSRRMNSELVKIGFVDRGAKTANFHMLREVKAYAVLPEIGFIDNARDNKVFDENIDEIAESIARSLLTEMGIKYIAGKGAVSQPKKKEVNTNLRYGSKGPKVTKLQEDLKKLGYDITVGGAYGKEVVKAVETFQSRHIGVPRSGEVCDVTERMIKNDLKAVEFYKENK